MAIKPDADVGTRDNILRLIIERGPITSAELASLLVLTSAAVRRHLTQLESEGQIAEYTGAASRPARRGRPSRRYVATSLGQATFGDSYADVANQVLSFLKDSLGEEGVNAFASQRIDELEARYTDIVDEAGPDPEARAAALVHAVGRLREVGHPRGHLPVVVALERASPQLAVLGRQRAYRRGSQVAVDAEVCTIDSHGDPPVGRGASAPFCRNGTILTHGRFPWGPNPE